MPNYRKRRDPAKYDRPWKELKEKSASIWKLKDYRLPAPYQQGTLWIPGHNHPSRSSVTGEPRKPPAGKPPVQTFILPSDSGHHPFGPSIIESYDPKHEGCGNLIPHAGTHPRAEEGALQHSVSIDGNYERLGGLKHLEDEVRWARAEIARIYEEGFKDAKFGGREDRKFDGEEFIETTLGIPELNFGTVDRLRYSADGTRAAVIDMKFGAWPVTPARRNLQLCNYAVYAFFLRRPMPHSVSVYLLHAKTRTISTHLYWRRSVYLLKARIAKIIARVEHGRTHGPESIGYFPNPSNCAWCERINCPARLDLASSMVSLWSKKPFVLPTPELLNVSTEQLGVLKSFANALSRCVEAINDECKRRAFDANDLIPGYEIRQKNGKRRIIGATNISAACNLVMKEWPKWFPQSPLELSQVALDQTELGVDDLEQAAGKAAPYGKILRARELVGQLLDNPALVQNNKVFYLAQNIPKQES